jgi:hypothetical protein
MALTTAIFGLLGGIAGAQPIPATQAFLAPACDAQDLANSPFRSRARINPEWKPILIDPNFPIPYNAITVLEGTVPPPSENETSSDGAPSEVSEEDIPTSHFTHDFTFKVIPDEAYFRLLSSWVNADGTIGTHDKIEVEWENASLMDPLEWRNGRLVTDAPDGFARDWGAVPEFAWPAVGDRVWIEGRWIFDCGHPYPDNYSGTKDTAHVLFSSEIHPPRALVTYRLNHTALDSFPRPRVSAPNFPAPQSYLPVTGEPVMPPGLPYGPPTNVPVTEADIFVSGNGGGASDLCNIVPGSIDPDLIKCDKLQPYLPPSPPAPPGGYTRTPIIPVNDRNYVFDIYPPGTDYLGFVTPPVNGTFGVAPPSPDASLQYRIVDHFSELPAHACGGVDNTVCVTVDPIICLIDSSTPPPDQTEIGCPPLPSFPTRVRVILPFLGTDANYFAKSILVGWDDVPAPPKTPVVRTFQVQLNNFTVKRDGNSVPGSADWRVFVNVGGQYRYMSAFFDSDANSGSGIYLLDGGTNVCHGNALTNTGDNDCFRFDNTPWTVSVVDGMPIHVAVGGYKADHILESYFCRRYPRGCLFDTFGTGVALIEQGFNRIGTYEFDLLPPDYTPPPSFTTAVINCAHGVFSCGLQYQVQFSVQEIPAATPPASAPLRIGLPNFVSAAGTYISAATAMIPQTRDPTAEGFQYRFHRQGDVLPAYPFSPPQPFPVHWAHVDLAPGIPFAEVRVDGANTGDGPYDFQYSAESFGNLLEPRHTTTVILDATPPVITIVQPAAKQYVHSATLRLSYAVTDAGSGVKTVTPKMDGATTLGDGTGLASGQAISLLTELLLGTHTFSIDGVDNVNNASTKSVTFSIIVTPDSIKDDVRFFRASGAIKKAREVNSLVAKLDAAAAQRANGNCAGAAKLYRAFINQLQAQSGKGVDATAAAIMIADAQYLIAHCP